MKRFFRVLALAMILAVMRFQMTAVAGEQPSAPDSASSPTEEIRVEDRGLELSEEISIRYPAVAGMADEALQEQINARILEDCRIGQYLDRSAALISGGTLRVEWTGSVWGGVFSCAVSASGNLETTRSMHVWTRSNLDLRDGHEIEFAELFTDEEAARERIGQYLEETVAPDLSAHLMNSELLPLPEVFFLETTGLRLLYPLERLSTLSDRAGDIRIPWYVLRESLDLGEDSVPTRIGAGEMISLSGGTAEKLRADAEEGSLPDIPARLGDSMQELTDRYHLLMDPDGYENGRMFALEGGSFCGVWLLTDDLGSGWQESRVQGIRVDRGCIRGLCTGETLRAEWLRVLGNPDTSVELDEEKAEANRVVPGLCDYYRCGDHRLQLYSDESGVLFSFVLAE